MSAIERGVVLLVVVSVISAGCVRLGFERADPVGDGGGPTPDRTDLPRPVDVAVSDATVPDVVDGPVDGPGAPGAWGTAPAGTFWMGSPTTEACRESGEILHEVVLSRAFLIQTTEVTQGQFLGLMGDNPAQNSSCGADCPVETVSWHRAAAYCNALSTLTKRTPCYSCTTGKTPTCTDAFLGAKIYDCPGYRLPTEAEWEYAYRAGTTTAYHNGPSSAVSCGCSPKDPSADAIAWYCNNSGSTTHAVATKKPNSWGLYDMGGNVYEWNHDWEGTLAGTKATDPWGVVSGTMRVVRGGAYTLDATFVRAANRWSRAPTFQSFAIGFRCVRTAP